MLKKNVSVNYIKILKFGVIWITSKSLELDLCDYLVGRINLGIVISLKEFKNFNSTLG